MKFSKCILEQTQTIRDIVIRGDRFFPGYVPALHEFQPQYILGPCSQKMVKKTKYIFYDNEYFAYQFCLNFPILGDVHLSDRILSYIYTLGREIPPDQAFLFRPFEKLFFDSSVCFY